MNRSFHTALLTVLTACAAAPDAQRPTPAAAPLTAASLVASTVAPTAAPTAAPGAAALTFTDALGRQVALEGVPARVVSLAPSVTEILIFADASEDYPQVSAEVIVERNPDVILGPDSHADKLTLELVAARPGWGELRAVAAGRVYLLDADIVSRPGPRLGEALEILAKTLYPERFK